MEVKIVKNAGFCFGVNNALKIINELVEKKKKVMTLGEIIHNDQVVNELKEKGVNVINSLSEAHKGVTLVIRSHGISKKILKDVKNSEINFVDATCPFVKKIHFIVERESKDKKFLLIAGDKNHDEIIGIRSYFKGQSYVFSNLEELKEIIFSKLRFFKSYKGVAVSQTTFSVEKWNKCIEFFNKSFTNIKIYDTICNITNLRQQESQKLAKISDLMIVIGGKKSSNTKKLYELCLNYTKTIWIESLEEIFNYNFENYKNISITAGASTPQETVLKVKRYLEFISN